MTKRTIWLIGMMGAGKTAVGRALARRLGLPFIDCDAEIEKRAGARISEIFAQQGEPAFRRMEAEVIREIAERPQVVSLGGGAAARPGMADYLLEHGTLVYLRARVDTLLARIGDARSRPLLRSLPRKDRRKRLEALQRERESSYSRAALIIDTDEITAEAVVDAILENL